MAFFFSYVKSWARYAFSPFMATHQPEVTQGHTTYKMLLIGETGSGKTSFLNLLCNYAQVQKLGSQELDDFKSYNKIELENALADKMQSKTTGATSYLIKLGELELAIIDTPGFGDSRGMKEDEKNVRKIIDALKDETYINCVCLVINGRQTRITATLQYVLSEITAILPKSIVDQIVVVFTNTADPLDLNFDVKVLCQYFGKSIDNSRYFIIENPFCKIEKAKLSCTNVRIEKIAGSLKKGFEETIETLAEMLESIQEYVPVHTTEFSDLYTKKQDIEREVYDLYEKYKYQTKLTKEVDVVQMELAAAVTRKFAYKEFRSVRQVSRYVRDTTAHHNTLCMFPNCYTVCHRECNLRMMLDSEKFKNCFAMNSDGYCKKCGHYYTQHFHDHAEYKEVTEDVEFIDEKAKKRFMEAQSEEQKIEIVQAELQQRQDEVLVKKQMLTATLKTKILEFQTIGLNRSYVGLMQSQLLLVKEYLNAEGNLNAKESLREIKDMLEKEIKLVQGEL